MKKEEINSFSEANKEDILRIAAHLKLAARRRIESIMGKGKVIRDVIQLVEEYVRQDTPLLFEGETGVGKKEIITYLHAVSPRGGKELITVDCGTIPESLIESELFGVKKGAYTDAKEDRIGKIEIANGSTLFLDEINSLSKAMQSKLLTLIQEKKITRVGDNKPIKVDVRIIAAGNENFKDLVKYNRFREDLYQRFVEKIRVPTLKERREDMDFFIDKFLKEKSDELGRKEVRITNGARNLLKNYPWEGNIRQLMNFIHRLVTRVKWNEKAEMFIIQSALVKKCYESEMFTEEQTPENNDFTMKTAVNTARKNAMERALRKTNGNNEKAIALLGMTRSSYYALKKKWGII